MIIPEFEKEYYERQIECMSERYKKIFASLKINWTKFYKFISFKLNESTFRIWIFLCGLEPILKECRTKSSKKEKLQYLTETSKKRIYTITKDDDKIKFFLRNL